MSKVLTGELREVTWFGKERKGEALKCLIVGRIGENVYVSMHDVTMTLYVI